MVDWVLCCPSLTIYRLTRSEHAKKPPDAKTKNVTESEKGTASEIASVTSAEAEEEAAAASVATRVDRRGVTRDPHLQDAGVMMTTSADQLAGSTRTNHLAATIEHRAAVARPRTDARQIARGRLRDAAAAEALRQILHAHAHAHGLEGVATPAVSVPPRQTVGVT